MNITLLILLFLLFLSPATGFTKNCENCSASKPCKVVVPKGDKCNTCDIMVHCSNDFWYQQEKTCTYLDCTLFTPVDNPFETDSAE